MRRFCCLCLALVMFALPAPAESPFSPYALTTPAETQLTQKDGTFTFVRGDTRVVAMTIERVPDAAPADAVIRMMNQFDPQSVIGADIPLTEGFVGLTAVNQDVTGEGFTKTSVMVLSRDGSLLILCGYSLKKDEAQVTRLLNDLLAGLTVDGVHIVAGPAAE